METEKEFKLCVYDSYCTSSGVYVCVCVDPEIFFSELFFCRKAYPEWRDILQASDSAGIFCDNGCRQSL